MQTINLNQNSFRLFPTIYMVQNDTGRELKMILDDVTLDGTETGAVAIKRSDGSYYTITATIDATNNAFDADMTQALTQPSRTECQLKVTASDDTVISTYTFVIEVQPSTDGLSEEQLGINPQDLIDAAAQLTLGDNDVKLALLQIAEKVVYIDEHGQDYYDALEDALYPPIRATSVTLDKNSLVFGGVGEADTLVATVSPNNVEDDTVYWGTSDKDVAVVSDGIVTATGNGSCTIYATCNMKHASASVTVTPLTLVSISVSYTQSGTIYDTGLLDDILTEGTLVVTATWSDASTSTVPNTDVTLAGSLTVGTSTITASYSGQSDAFSVIVTLDRVGRFGNFTNQRAISKANTSTAYPQYVPFAYVTKNTVTARACISVPVANNGYTFTVTDGTKYSINIVDITSDSAISVPNYTDAKDRIVWSAGSKTVGWNTTDSVTTDFLFIALKKNDNTNFTDAELANAAEAVFTFTES